MIEPYANGVKMLQYVTGNLLDTSDPYIAHGCNSSARMGAGVALQIARRYPWVAEKFKETYKWEVGFHGRGDGLPLGAVYEYSQRDAPYRILNLITQRGYGRDGKRYLSYDALDDAFRAVRKKIGTARLSIPRIGAGLGGGSWVIVAAIIEENFRDSVVTVWDLS